MGNEWDILGITRNDESLVTKAQKEAYVKSIKECIKEGDKLLINGKPTNIEKVVIGLTSIGEDVKNIAGQNLLKNIYDNPKISDGSNESVFALLALDTLNYDVPNNAKWTRDKLIEEIKTYQNSNGGFGLFDSETVSIDMTAMALQALSTYKDREDVKLVIEKALNYLRNNQTEYGGFKDSGKENVESVAQVLVALTSLGLDPLDPANKFGDKNYNLVTNILSYRDKNDEGFKHWKDDHESNGMSTNQAYYALVSYLRFIDHKSKFYDMKNKKQDVVAQKEDKKKFEIENLTSKKEFKLGGNAQVAIKATNKCKQNKDATLIVGMFDKEGKLINYGACEKNVKLNESDSLKVQLLIPKEGHYTVKGFVWDNLKDMNPISEIVNIPVK